MISILPEVAFLCIMCLLTGNWMSYPEDMHALIFKHVQQRSVLSQDWYALLLFIQHETLAF